MEMDIRIIPGFPYPSRRRGRLYLFKIALGNFVAAEPKR